MWSFKKNLAAGMIPLIILVFLKWFWGVVAAVTGMLDPVVRNIPLIGDFVIGRMIFGPIAGFTIEIFFLMLCMYLTGLLLRSIGLRVGRDLEHARKWTRRANRFKPVWLLWRLLIGLAVLADALEGLTGVMVEEYGGQNFGVITKVQRVYHRSKRRWHWRFIVYLGDFPTFILGRIRWYRIERCEKVLNPLGEMFVTLASIGFAAPSDLDVDNFNDDDLLAISATLKKKEPMLLAAGLLGPDHPIVDEEERLQSGENGSRASS